MTETLNEQLSCFLDGELPEAETTLLLKRLERDEELKGTLSRYSLIGTVLRAEGEVPAARHVAARVRDVVAREPALRERSATAGDRWRRPFAGLALAAGVAAAAVLVLPAQQRGSGEAPAAVVAMSVPAAATGPVALAEIAPVVAAADEPPAPVQSYTTPPVQAGPGNALSAAQLASYLLAHSEYTNPLAGRSVVTGAPELPAPARPAAEGSNAGP